MYQYDASCIKLKHQHITLLMAPFTVIDTVYRLLLSLARLTRTAMHICSAMYYSIRLKPNSLHRCTLADERLGQPPGLGGIDTFRAQGYAPPHFLRTFILSQLCDAGAIQIMKRGRAAEPEAAKRVRRSTQSRRRLAPPSPAALRIDLTFPLVFRILSVESYKRSGARG